MFKELKDILYARGGEAFGFLTTRELDDCGKDVMAVFGISKFIWDYEDTCEWVEGDGPGGFHVNISRPHNQKTGKHGVPVVVRVSASFTKLTGEFVSLSAQKLANQLQTEVWIGCVDRSKSEIDYDFTIERRFTPVG